METKTAEIKVGKVWMEDGKLKGVQVGKDWWLADKESGLTGDDFEEGKTVPVSYTTNAKGRNFIKAIVKAGDESPKPQPKKEATKSDATNKSVGGQENVGRAKGSSTVHPVAWGRELSPYELEKDIRIGVAGIVQAVAQSQALTVFIHKREDYAPVVEEESRKLLAVVKKLVKEA